MQWMVVVVRQERVASVAGCVATSPELITMGGGGGWKREYFSTEFPQGGGRLHLFVSAERMLACGRHNISMIHPAVGIVSLRGVRPAVSGR